MNQDVLGSWGDYIHIKDYPRTEYEEESKNGVTNTVNVNPLVPPKFIIVKNGNNHTFKVLETAFFENTVFRGFENYPDYDPDEVLPE